jgi:hypothetical protein
MRPWAHRLTVLALVLAAALVPARASALTLDDIVSLSRAGVTDAVILALIDRDKPIFSIEPDQLVALKSQGVSEAVILAMLKSGREEGERAAQAAADLNAGFIMSGLAPAPDVVVVGHGPDVPNGGYSSYSNAIYGVPPMAGLITVPYAVGGGFGGGRRRHMPPATAVAPAAVAEGRTFISPFAAPYNSPFGANAAPVVRPVQTPAAPALCIAQVRGANSLQPLSFVTRCPGQ